MPLGLVLLQSIRTFARVLIFIVLLMVRFLTFVLTAVSVCCTCVAQDRKQLRDSLAKASEELAFHPDSLELRLRKASWNLQLEEWQYAKDEYDYVLTRNPQNIAALYYRAFVNEKQKRYKFARLDYEHLLYLVPGNFEAMLGLALLNQKDNRYTDALNMINILVAQHPDSAVAYAARGGIEMERKMYDLAEFDYGKAFDLSHNTDYLLCRANVRILMKRKEYAREDLDEMVRRGIPCANLAEWYRLCR